MDKLRKLELIQRSLGLRHKLKVHESMKQPDTHEDIAIMLLTRWEYEDELRAIEELLAESRQRNVARKRATFEHEDSQMEEMAHPTPAPAPSPADSDPPKKRPRARS